MTSVLIIFAFIIAIVLLFWLDRKDKEDKDEGERTCEEVFKLFNRIDWGKNFVELKDNFSDKELVSLKEDVNSFFGTGYRDKFDNQDVLVHLYFAKDENGKIIGVEIQFPKIPQNILDILFSKLCERYGSPPLPDDTEEKPVLWNIENGILTLETSSSQTLLLSLWNKDLYKYNKVNKEAE